MRLCARARAPRTPSDAEARSVGLILLRCLPEVVRQHGSPGAVRPDHHAGVDGELLELVFGGPRVAWDLDAEACGLRVGHPARARWSAGEQKREARRMDFDCPICLFCLLPEIQGGPQHGSPR